MNSNHTPDPKLSPELSKAVTQMAQLEVPEASVARLIDDASVHPNPIPIRTLSKPPQKLPQRTKRHWHVAAIAAVAAIVLISFILIPTSSNAFGRMQDTIAKFKTMQLVSRVIDGNGKQIQEIKSFVREPRMVRQEFADNTVLIADLSKQKALRLDLSKKTAQRVTLQGPDTSSQLFDAVIGVLRGTDFQSASKVGRRTFKGKKAIEFEVKTGQENALLAHVLIEAKSNLPLKVELPLGPNGVYVEATVFVFDAELDEKLFSLTTPNGFNVIPEDSFVSLDAANLVLKPQAKTIGPIEFGFSTEQVIELMGKPDVLGHPANEEAIKMSFLNYHRIGIQVTVHPEHGTTSVACLDYIPKFGVRKFTGTYQGGIRIGDSEKTITEVLGEPTSELTSDSIANQLVYNSEEFRSVFNFEDSKLKSMSVSQLPQKKD